MVRCHHIHSETLRGVLAEFLGTFVFGSFVMGSSAQNTFSNNPNTLQANLASGIGLMVGIYISGGVSGGHLNPAVTLACCLGKKTSWKRLPFYWISQLLAAVLAAALQYGICYDVIEEFNGNIRNQTTAAIFVTYPPTFTNTYVGFSNQVYATFFFCGGILAIIDSNSTVSSPNMAPLAIGLLLTAVVSSYGLNGGPAVNPALDLGPRIVLLLAGWGVEPFTFRNLNWFWVPIVGPLLGSFLGWLFYHAFVAHHWSEMDTFSDFLSSTGKYEDSATITRL
ncbi:aquaporin-8 isoform X2 [Octopus sinensis]|uniref:Aquaporin-8 isoform X2 n=1 Tax=Octopus sinensis TaxID=2607531 RepID=A0A6P7SV88_9MOLL|nr:aquaporin-8 isoform X2 [Octopus sinensis]